MNDLIKRISEAKEMIERKPNQHTVDYTIYGVLTDCDNMLKSQQAEIERMKREGKTCANCSMCKTRKARGTGCYYQRCKKHNMWVRYGFYCSDWQKEGD